MEDPYEPEPPFRYECVNCGDHFDAESLTEYDVEGELVECPECGGDVWNLTTPSHE
ncbi:MAG: hypothetical protein ABEJ88_07980 [Halobacterium sp.]